MRDEGSLQGKNETCVASSYNVIADVPRQINVYLREKACEKAYENGIDYA